MALVELLVPLLYPTLILTNVERTSVLDRSHVEGSEPEAPRS